MTGESNSVPLSLQETRVAVARLKRQQKTWVRVAMELNGSGEKRGGRPWTALTIAQWYSRHSPTTRRHRGRAALLAEVSRLYAETRAFHLVANRLSRGGWTTLTGQRLTRANVRHYLTRPEYGLRDLYPELRPEDDERPRRRGECEAGRRPCPWATCRHHLAHDLGGRFERVQELQELQETCALDVAAMGAHSITEIADYLDLSRNTAWATLQRAMGKVAARTGWGDQGDIDWLV